MRVCPECGYPTWRDEHRSSGTIVFYGCAKCGWQSKHAEREPEVTEKGVKRYSYGKNIFDIEIDLGMYGRDAFIKWLRKHGIDESHIMSPSTVTVDFGRRTITTEEYLEHPPKLQHVVNVKSCSKDIAIIHTRRTRSFAKIRSLPRVEDKRVKVTEVREPPVISVSSGENVVTVAQMNSNIPNILASNSADYVHMRERGHIHMYEEHLARISMENGWSK